MHHKSLASFFIQKNWDLMQKTEKAGDMWRSISFHGVLENPRKITKQTENIEKREAKSEMGDKKEENRMKLRV